jgi:hypothetical protein
MHYFDASALATRYVREVGDPNMPYLGLWPFLEYLHREPRFQALHRRLGLPEQVRGSGWWPRRAPSCCPWIPPSSRTARAPRRRRRGSGGRRTRGVQPAGGSGGRRLVRRTTSASGPGNSPAG